MKAKRFTRWILSLIAILLVLCAAAVVLEAYFPVIPETDAGQKVLAYAEKNGLSYRDYPESLIDLLERNPETEKFVLEYPIASKETFSIDLSEYKNCETVPLLMQWDQRWGYLRYGKDVAGLTACGPVCLSMAAIYLTGDSAYSPDRMIRFASENNYYVSGSGSSWTLMSKGCKDFDLIAKEIILDENAMVKALEASKPIICAMGPGVFTDNGHYIVLTGYVDGAFTIHDPNSPANTARTWTYNEIKDQIRNIWSFAPV